MPSGFSPPTGYAAAMLHADREVKKQLDTLLSETADRVRSQGVEVEVRLLGGPAAQMVVDEAASGDHPMIVLGPHGYGGFKRFLLGSVAERIVRTANVPVLTVPTQEPGAALG